MERMEPPDLPLIEISSEEDSFLQEFSAGDITGTLDCSPFNLSRSCATKVNSECGGLSTSSSYSNKENLDTADGKSGMPTLSIERQRMKRSRKGGGYNLRKSLAWNRAFLTEEGVLDPSELSMITGTMVKFDGDNMSAIDEESRDLSFLNSDSARNSANNLKTLDEDSHKELPSSYGNRRSSTKHGSILKRDSLPSRNVASLSKSSQKIPLRSNGSRSVSKGGVASSPMLHASQKRLLTIGSPQAVTRNSKIPKFPVSKQDTSQHNHTSGGGSCLKPIGIAQTATQKSASLKASSAMKNGSAVKALFKGTPTKSSSESARKDTTKSNSEMHTSKASKILKITSNKELPTDGVNVIDRASGVSRTVVSSHPSSVNLGGSQKDVQEKGLRPSGLRKPSPSLRYFSEPINHVSNAPLKYNITPLNLPKPSIPSSMNFAAVNHVRDLKPAQLLQRGHNKGNKGSEDECTQKKANYPVETDNVQSRSPILIDFDRCLSHVPASLMNEERDSKDCKRDFSIESEKANGRASIGSQEHETCTGENTSEGLEVQIINDSGRNRSGQQQLIENMEYMLGLEKEGNQSCSTEFNKEAKHNQAVRVEYQQLHVDNKPGDTAVDVELSTDDSKYLEMQDELRGKDESLLMNDNFKFSLKFRNHDSRDIPNVNPEAAGYELSVTNDSVMRGFETASTSYQSNVSQSDKKGGCSTNCTTAGEYNDLSTIKISEYSEMQQHNVSMMDDDILLSDDAICFKDEQYTLENHDSEETSSVNSDVQEQRQPEIKGRPIQSHITEASIEDALFDSFGFVHATSIECNYLKRDRRESLSGIDENIHKVCNNPEEVEDQTNSPTHWLNNGNSNNQTTISEDSSSPGERHELQPRNAFMKTSLDDSIEHDKTESSVSPTECEATVSEDVHGLGTEDKCNKNGMDCIDEDVSTSSKLETCPDDKRQIRLPTNVTPFSDEWLAAIEAAGEEILTMKTGAVQNSPPDKPITEPSPWSPVKRKSNQVIGPFDCTKYTNAQHNDSG